MPGCGSGVVVVPWSSPRSQHRAAVARIIHLLRLFRFPEPPLSASGCSQLGRFRMFSAGNGLNSESPAPRNVHISVCCLPCAPNKGLIIIESWYMVIKICERPSVKLDAQGGILMAYGEAAADVY